MTHTTESMVTQADKSLIEKLRFRAQAASEASKMLAEAKSLRQADNPEGRDDLYEWSRPEQMTEWIAADRIEELLRTAAQPEREAVEPVAWAPTSFRGEGYVYRRKDDAETLTGPATPLYDSRALKTTPAPAVSTDEIVAVRAADLALARCLDLLGHIRDRGFYPPQGDAEALAELNDHIESGDRARAILSRIRGEGE